MASFTSPGAGGGGGGASSPYAPTRRNSYLRHSSSSSMTASAAAAAAAAAATASSSSSSSTTTTVVALFLFVIKYWRRVYDNRDSIKEQLSNWVKNQSRHLLDVRFRPHLPALLPSVDSLLKNILVPLPFPTFRFRDVSSSSPPPPTTTMTIQRIQENQRLINEVLEYWFGQYPPDKSQKMLWMIGNSSIEHRRFVDKEITTRFLPLLLELMDSSSTTTRWTEWCCADPDSTIYGHTGKVAAIIVLDQFSRHIQRHFDDEVVKVEEECSRPSSSSSSSFLPSKTQLDQQALKTAKLLFEPECSASDLNESSSPTPPKKSTHFEKLQAMLPLPMMIFALMPYRHASTIESVSYVQQCIDECSSHQHQLDEMLSRFRKATNRRMALLQDEARRTGQGKGKQKQEQEQQQQQPTKEAEPTKKQFSDEDILETFAFEADMTPSLKHPIHKTIVDFLTARGIHPSKQAQLEPQPPSASVIVSLSGGVDSMVIASVLSYLQKSCEGYSHLSIWAVHIDYGNRPESSAEADFVRRYCEETLQNVHFICRRIDEVTRGITARDDYERIAREIRYNSYRETIAAAKRELASAGNDNISNKNTSEAVIGVMLGHHRGDLRENVLSNAHKGCGPLDLSGMTSVSTNDGIVIYRPLLPLEKSFVLDYAHTFGVPYFLDTTPSWSTRGKLRNKLLPLLEEIYGDGSMNNLSNLAVESDECRELLQESMIAPFMKAIVKTPMGIIMETAPWKDQGMFFWKFVLREALHQAAGLGMFSDKSVASFLERVQAKKVREGWLQCRKDYGVYLQADGKVFVFYPSSFPWNKEKSFGVMGQTVNVGENREVGPWTVKTELVASGTPYIETLLSKKAIPNMETLMDGQIDYYLECSCVSDGANSNQRRVTKPLVFREFRRTDRPVAWKSADLRVQSTLPILGVQPSDHDEADNEKLLIDGEDVNEGTAVVRISLYLRDGNERM